MNDLIIDEDRYPEGCHPHTGIYIRGKHVPADKYSKAGYESVDISVLTNASLDAWLESKGPGYAAKVLALVLGYDQAKKVVKPVPQFVPSARCLWCNLTYAEHRAGHANGGSAGIHEFQP